MPEPESALVRLLSLERWYGDTPRTQALHPTDLEIAAGDVVVILGPSGSGKSTLLNLVGGLDTPSAGVAEVAGRSLATLDDRALTDFRRDHVGFVFQFFNLVPALTVAENIELAAALTRTEVDVAALLADVGLADLGDRFPSELSGGQQQRVAVARALAKRPPLLLCDEPTGALDEETGKQVLRLLVDAARKGATVLIVTHHGPVAAIADRVLKLRDGRVVGDDRNDDPIDPLELRW